MSASLGGKIEPANRTAHPTSVAEATTAADTAQRDAIHAAAGSPASDEHSGPSSAGVTDRVASALDSRVGSWLRLSVLAFTVLITALFVAVYELLGPNTPWAIYVGAALAGLLCVPGARPYRNPPVLALLGLWVSFAASAQHSAQWHPTWKIVINDTRGFAAAALISTGVVLLSRGRRNAVNVLRGAWLAVFALSLPMGMREVITGEHPLRPASSPWTGPPHSPSSYFINPNNYAVILVVVIGVALLWLTERTSRWVRALLVLSVATAAFLLWHTHSRAGIAGAVLTAIMASVLAAGRTGHLARWGRWHRRHPFIVGAASLGAFVAALVPFIVPSVAARNPLFSVLLPGDADTIRSDSARVALIRHGIDFWLSRPWTGIGAARYEWALAAVEHPAVPRVLPAHNGFIELLAERGLVMGAPLALLLMLLAWRVVRPRCRAARPTPAQAQPTQLQPRRSQAGFAGTYGKPLHLDGWGGRCLLAVYLLGFVLGGVVISSPLMWFPWWLLLASATATSWWLDNLRQRSLKNGSSQCQETAVNVRPRSLVSPDKRSIVLDECSR